jgi:hypothetical protein
VPRRFGVRFEKRSVLGVKFLECVQPSVRVPLAEDTRQMRLHERVEVGQHGRDGSCTECLPRLSGREHDGDVGGGAGGRVDMEGLL